MQKERYNKIFEQVTSISAKVGDIPHSAAEPQILSRLRQFTDDYDFLKELSSEVRFELVEVERSLRALRGERRYSFREALLSHEVQSLTGQQSQKEAAEFRASERCDGRIEASENILADLTALSGLIEDRALAVKTSMSNLRKEWELVHAQKGLEQDSDRRRGYMERHGIVEEASDSDVLHVVKEGGLGGSPDKGQETGSAEAETNLSVDEILESLG
jgi:hypothetical protein